jgi:hypothetical protein
MTVSYYNLREMTAPLSITVRRLILKALGMGLLATVCHARDRANPKVDNWLPGGGCNEDPDSLSIAQG